MKIGRLEWFRLRLAILPFFIVCGMAVGAEDDPWAEFSKRAAKEPPLPGLTLYISAPRNIYFTGEPIPIALAYEMDGPNKVDVWIGTYDRSGRISDLYWFVVGPDGKRAPDPIEGLGGSFGGGLGNEETVSEEHSVTQTFYVNEWAWFGQSGTYEIAVISHRLNPEFHGGMIASNRIKIRIRPWTQEHIDEAIEEYRRLIAQREYDENDEPEYSEESHKGMLFMRFLHNEKAIDDYLRFIKDPYLGFDAATGLVGIPDKQKAFKALYDELVDKDYAIDGHVLSPYKALYASLNPPPPGEKPDWPGRPTKKQQVVLEAELRKVAETKTPEARALSILTLTPWITPKTDSELVMLLAKCLKDLPPYGRIGQAMIYLQNSRNPDVVPYIEPLLKHEDAYMRSQAITALIALGVQKYITIAQDEWASERPAFEAEDYRTEKFFNSFPEDLQLKLAKVLGNPDNKVAAAAARRLGLVASSKTIIPYVMKARDRFTKDLRALGDVLLAWVKVDPAGAKEDLMRFVRSGKYYHDVYHQVGNYLDDPDVRAFLLEEAKKEMGMNDFATEALARGHVQEVVPIILEYQRSRLQPNTGGGGIDLLEIATGHMLPSFMYVDTVEQEKTILDQWEAFWKKYKDEPPEVRTRAEIEYLLTMLTNKDEYVWVHRKLEELTGHRFEDLPSRPTEASFESGEESPPDPPMEKVQKLWQDWWKANKDTFKAPASVP